MTAPIIQASYPALEQTARGFLEEHARAQRVRRALEAQVETLRRGGWLSDASTQFYRDFDSDLLPGLQRLESALMAAVHTTRDISKILQQAEAEAAMLVSGGDAGDEGTAGATKDELIDRFRQRNDGQPATPLLAGAFGVALPLAGGAAVVDGPLPFGDAVALGILGVTVAGVGIAALANLMSSSTPAPNPNVDPGKVEEVQEETNTQTGNITSGQELNDDEAIEALDEWLGDDYEDLGNGTFRSRQPNADGTYNQGRIDDGSLQGNHPPNRPHIHLQRVRPDPNRPGRWQDVTNNHIPLNNGGGTP